MLMMSGEIAVVVAAEIVVRVRFHVVALVLLALLVFAILSEILGVILRGAISRGDVVDAGIAGETAVGLIGPGTLARCAAEGGLMAAHHPADAVEQKRATDHTGGRGRRGSEK